MELRTLYLGDRYAHPAPPVEMADEAQKWSRDTGRRFGRMAWEPFNRCFAIHFGRRPHDPVLREWQEGRLHQAEEPTESILLQEPDPEKPGRLRPMDLGNLGPSGLRSLLDQASLTSGRGEHNSLQAAVIAAQEHNQKVRANLKAMARESGREMDWLLGRTIRGTPYITAGIDLKKGEG